MERESCRSEGIQMSSDILGKFLAAPVLWGTSDNVLKSLSSHYKKSHATSVENLGLIYFLVFLLLLLHIKEFQNPSMFHITFLTLHEKH